MYKENAWSDADEYMFTMLQDISTGNMSRIQAIQLWKRSGRSLQKAVRVAIQKSNVVTPIREEIVAPRAS